jgi:hypothetical protein
MHTETTRTAGKPWRMARVPCGRHAGRKWRQVPDAALRGILAYWSSPDREPGRLRDAALAAASAESAKRAAKSASRRVSDPRASRSIVVARR